MLGRQNRARFSPEVEEQIKVLWEEGLLTASEIGKKFDVSKNVILGIADRRFWEKRRAKRIIKTTAERLDAIEANFDAVLKECVGVGRLAHSDC